MPELLGLVKQEGKLWRWYKVIIKNQKKGFGTSCCRSFLSKTFYILLSKNMYSNSKIVLVLKSVFVTKDQDRFKKKNFVNIFLKILLFLFYFDILFTYYSKISKYNKIWQQHYKLWQVHTYFERNIKLCKRYKLMKSSKNTPYKKKHGIFFIFKNLKGTSNNKHNCSQNHWNNQNNEKT